MSEENLNKTNIEIGFVVTHSKFEGSLIPLPDGSLPQNSDGSLVLVDAVKRVLVLSPVKIDAVQVSLFGGTNPEDWSRIVAELADLNLGMHPVVMLGELDPMNPADEDAAARQLLNVVNFAKKENLSQLSSTSLERWMQPLSSRRNGDDFDAALAQLVKLHTRVFEEGNLENSSISHWDIEFLRPGEFATFSDLGRLWSFVKNANLSVSHHFFRCLIDTAHCGDSALSLREQQILIEEIAQEGGLGMMHASSPTTRGCLSADKGWIAPLLKAGYDSGKLEQVFVEIFHHEDPALEPLRQLVPGHGVDTTNGRGYSQIVANGLTQITHMLNSFQAKALSSN